MTRYKAIALLASFLLLPCITIARGKTIYTSSVKNWTPASLEQLVNECEEGSTIVFDADYDYTIDRCIKPKVSISIKGKGKRIRTINPYNYVISLFDVRDVDSFEIDNLILDGSYSTSNPDRTVPMNFFLTIKDVNKVSITRCTFQNIRTVYPNWKEGDEAYTIWVENYLTFKFTDNIVRNVRCAEFLKAVLPIDNTDSKRFADISRNKLDFESTSTAIEVRFGRYRINNNEIGMTRGSCINAFGFDSEIVGNYFHGSHNSSSIDLSEQFFFKYVSHKILIKNNYSEYSKYGFLMANTVHDISIINNSFRADICDEEVYERFVRIWYPTEKGCDRALMLNGDISNIRIIHNRFEGANALLACMTLGHKKNIIIDRNYVKNVSSPVRSTLVLTQSEGVTISRNTFINTGSTYSYFDKPQFIVIGPTDTDNASERYIRNLVISKNRFLFSDNIPTEAYIFIHAIYDRNMGGALSSLSDILIKGNTSDFRGDIYFASDNSMKPDNSKPVVSLKRNRLKNGVVMSTIEGD